MNSLELRVWNFVCKSYQRQRIEYYKKEYQKYLERDLDCFQAGVLLSCKDPPIELQGVHAVLT